MEDNLERVLHCDDKEELRRKLALLQREYSRTVQRLQRAERSDAVRKHVRSRISEQNLQDQTDPVPASTFPNPALPSLSPGSPARTAPGSASPPGPAGDSTVAASCPVESENPRRRSPSIRFLLPVDDSCPRTPDLNPHRRSHSLRLRSRRSRLRWERTGRVQGGEGAGGMYDTETSEDGLELDARTDKEEDGEKRNMEEEKEGEREENERDTPDKEALKQRDGEERKEQRTYGQKEMEKEGVNLRRDGEHEREEGGDSGAVGVSVLGAVGLCNTGGVLDSCTLVEGLPFPVEYYIRTTRRMASSQSHRDLQAVILNQLNRGRHRRSRGQMSDTHSLSTSHSDSLAQPSNHRQCSSQLTSNSPTNRTPVEEPSANQMLTAESGANQSERLPSRACSVRPIRGRRRRGRKPRLGRSLSLDSDPPAPGPDNTQTPAAISPASQPLPGGGCLERWPLSGGVEEQLYPIFRRSCVSPLIHTSKQSKESVWSLLLPSSLSPGGPAVHPGSLGRVISTFDLRDFHLPDDQFGQLKLQKLRASSAVAVPELESFSPYNMRRRRSRGSVHGLHGDTGGQTSKAPTPEPLPLSLTPPITDCVTPVEQSIDISIGQHLIDHPIGQQSTDSLDHSTDLHSEYHSVCQFTDHLVDQPTGHQSTDHLVDQPTGHQSIDHLVDQPTGHQSTDHLVDQPTGHQSTDHLVDQPTGHQFTDHLVDQPTGHQSTDNPVDQPTGHQSTDHPVDQPIGHQSTDNPVDQHTGHQSTDHPVDQLIGHQLTVLVCQSIDFPSVDQQTGRLTTECPSLQTETVTECPPECPSFHTKTKCLSPCPTEFSVECLTKCPSMCITECPSLRTETDAECAVPPSPSLLLLSPSLTSHTRHGHTHSLPLSSSPPLPSLGMSPNPLTTNPNIPLSLPDSPPLRSLEAVTHILSCPPCPSSLPLSCPPCPSSLPLSCPPFPPTLPLPLSCSPCPPTLTLPFPSSPSTQALSPPSLSPCPSPAIPLSSSPPSLALCHPSLVDSLPQLLLPPTPLLLPQSLPPTPNTPSPSPPTQLLRQPAPSLHSTRQATEERGEGEEERAWRKKEEKRRDGMTEEGVLKLSHTLKAPAGGSLVDVCCVSWLSVGVCVAVAGEWEVCVWGQTNPPHWRRLHTWTFIESVMSVFPVPDAPGLLCVTLGHLEIREARVLCCSSLSQAVLCEGEVQMVLGMSNRRLVSSSYSVATTPLQVYTLTQDGRLQACLSLVCPTERVRTVAAVEGQTDALIGSTHGGHVVLWNVATGQLLRSITLGDGFTDTTCLRGYSLCGVLFVLLQHPSLCAVEEEEGGALFSLVATNPLTGTVALATRLGLPKACTGRLVEVDVHGSSVVGVFRSGSVCVWQLGGRQGQQGVWFPELGCQLARWGAQGTVLTAHLNGDVCLHSYRPL
ncbi:uncharacterized protein LOC129839047 isoform X1 [Salvelinus fontinalis]|uniref:uncharacterized protein LOC129839047 isoform X1 n=1 Tax=Salvelinus fontinalis TaxID=8038 RepID=UPI0024850E26|nr:uncharacterized protein LOC129839047 isoform X1 [Salvelinus fontinalis]